MGAWRSAFNERDLTRYEIRAIELYPDEEFLRWAHSGATGGEWRLRVAVDRDAVVTVATPERRLPRNGPPYPGQPGRGRTIGKGP
jgi:hypothetical protein